jgi:hypothetical protein
MTLNEFKAWLDGYEESFADYSQDDIFERVPSATQWRKIKEKLAAVQMIPGVQAPTGAATVKMPDYYKERYAQDHTNIYQAAFANKPRGLTCV